MLAVNFTLISYLQSSNLQTVSLSKFHKSVFLTLVKMYVALKLSKVFTNKLG